MASKKWTYSSSEEECPPSSRFRRDYSFEALAKKNVPAKLKTKVLQRSRTLIKDKMHIVYILSSIKDRSKYYIGRTQDLDKRLKKHNSSQVNYSKRYAPWQIETHIEFRNEHLAVQFEKYLKSGSGHAFLKKRLLPKVNRI